MPGNEIVTDMALSTSKQSQHTPCVGKTSYNVFNVNPPQALISALLLCVSYSMNLRDKLSSLFDRLASEEVLIASGLPYVILRCGDLIGPRDTTYRWWQYQVIWHLILPHGISLCLKRNDKLVKPLELVFSKELAYSSETTSPISQSVPYNDS